MNAIQSQPSTQAAQSPTETIVGEVTDVPFRNEDTGYSVMRLTIKAVRDPLTVVGVSMARVGETVTVEGRWKVHPKFGRQMEAVNVAVARPASAAGIERYLASGVIKGIGPATAKRIVGEFGERTFEVFDNEPDRISLIKGIGKARAAEIVKVWQETQAERQVQVFLAGYNIVGALAHRIIRKYGGTAIEVVEKEPYRLAKEVRGIGFLTADTIALSLGMPMDAPPRIEAGLRHVVSTAAGVGHCGIPVEKYLAGCCDLLKLPAAIVEPAVREHLRLREFMVRVMLAGDSFVFDKRLHDAEERIAKGLLELAKRPPKTSETQAARLAGEAETICGVTLAPEQRHAVQMALLRPVSILTGGPGTGKTSTLKVILEALRRIGADVVLGAPTGKAAKRMTESTGFPASTVARLIGMGRMQEEDTPIECSILILDESSMVDVSMLDRVLKCLEDGASLLFVGDIDQLPSVGAGRVLGDMIESGIIPTTRLTQVFRQAATSAIIRNAHRINKGQGIETPVAGDDTDFYFIEANTPEEVSARIAAMVQKHIPARMGIRSQDIQVLSPMRKSGTGTESLNALLQSTLNPSPDASVTKFGRRYGVGDRVLQTVNNYDLGVMNGESGIITAVDSTSDTMTVEVDGESIAYPFADLDQLDLAYAMTVHKSQGSQFPAVIIPVTTQHYVMLQRPIIYTGITRATKFCVLVGQRRALEMAIENARMEPRITALQSMLERHSDVW